MSIQDDYFDLAAFLEGKPEAELLENIWGSFCKSEEYRIKYLRVVNSLIDLKESIEKL